jgi:hypothetical protein
MGVDAPHTILAADAPLTSARTIAMSELDRFREYVSAMCGHRRIPASMRDTLYKLLETPRIRERFAGLSPEEMKAVADSLVFAEGEVAPKRGRRRIG